MIKLNNKGMTIIEILVCFVLVVSFSVGLFSTLNNYRTKMQMESNRSQIVKYKNLLTKEIQDDLIKKRLIAVDISDLDTSNKRKSKYVVDFKFLDGTSNKLIIVKELAAYSDEVISGSSAESDKIPANLDIDDNFSITYNDTLYKLPNIGEYKNDNNKIVYDFKINNVSINTNDGVLSLYIGFYHPDFGTRYAIDIVCPINYQ